MSPNDDDFYWKHFIPIEDISCQAFNITPLLNMTSVTSDDQWWNNVWCNVENGI